MIPPSMEEVRRITAMADAAPRNLEITRVYFELSRAIAEWLPGGANWCTFAAWASRQAGQTIRREDLLAAVIRHPLLGPPLAGLSKVTGIGVSQLQPVLEAALGEAEPFRSTSEAVGRGNKKVFDEIGLEFSRFLRDFADLKERDDSRIEDFVAVLAGGPPPHGQQELKEAFRNYYEAKLASGKRRAELLLLANLQVGFHEQTRLQPEIQEALDAAGDPERLTQALFHRLMPRDNRLIPVTPGLGLACRLLADAVRRVGRIVVTQKLMTLEIGREILRLGQDLRAGFPPSLAKLTEPDLTTFVALVDPTVDSLRGSGAADWADFGERMHFIADLFRTHQETQSLFVVPEQA